MPKKGKKHKPSTARVRINNPHRESTNVKVKAGTVRDNATIRRLKMYSQRPDRDRKGRLRAQQSKDLHISHTTDYKVARVQPDRRWFGNTRVVGQKQLDRFREEMSTKINDPYTIILKRKKIPLGLLADSKKNVRMNLLSAESFESTFGPKARRKRPRLMSADMDSLAVQVVKQAEEYSEKDDTNIKVTPEFSSQMRECIFNKGQSKRIWGELYKVIDSSDVLIQVLDVRDPMGTRSKHIEKQLRKYGSHKHLIFVLNKCDLVPTWVTARWIKVLSAEYPTLAFHASITNPFGKGSLIQLLRQFASLHKEKKQISVGFIGYPNVGKSSVINTLRQKKVCKVASIPGETKVWQYITLFSRIYLIDCPGVVYPVGDTDVDLVLKGVVRVENIDDPAQYIAGVLERVRPLYLQRAYKITEWENDEDFLTKFAKNRGKLLKGGEPDFNNASRMILHDWQRGKLPWFVRPPFEDDLEFIEEENARKKRKLEERDAWKKPKYEAVQDIEKISSSHRFDENDLRQNLSEYRKSSIEDSIVAKSTDDSSSADSSTIDEKTESNEVSPETVEQSSSSSVENLPPLSAVQNPLGLLPDDPLYSAAQKHLAANRRSRGFETLESDSKSPSKSKKRKRRRKRH
uniref:Nucleolar GTP-binding protein 2 n=1 Tax=Hirondellea gigas TaxID=1518452 RepID=A0A6A7G1G5_9CRUS